MKKENAYKVVLIFTLTKGSADEEIRRSQKAHSFPSLLSQQPGFIEIELVKINDEKTMSIQTWESAAHWYAALDSVKKLQQESPQTPRENILISRDFLGGVIRKHHVGPFDE